MPIDTEHISPRDLAVLKGLSYPDRADRDSWSEWDHDPHDDYPQMRGQVMATRRGVHSALSARDGRDDSDDDTFDW